MIRNRIILTNFQLIMPNNKIINKEIFRVIRININKITNKIKINKIINKTKIINSNNNLMFK